MKKKDLSTRFGIIGGKSGGDPYDRAAYDWGVTLSNPHTGRKYNYNRKRERVFHSNIFYPKHTPAWIRELSLQHLIDEAIKLDVRKDAQYLRRLRFSHPSELRMEEQVIQVQDALEMFTLLGMVVIAACHRPIAENNPENYHTHVLLLMRDVVDDGFGKKNRSWNDRRLAVQFRKKWTEQCNRLLSEKGLATKIEYRKFEDRGEDKEPKIFMSKGDLAKEKQGIKTERGEYNREVERRNDKRALLEKQKEQYRQRERNHEGFLGERQRER